jgi:hypothetical protein
VLCIHCANVHNVFVFAPHSVMLCHEDFEFSGTFKDFWRTLGDPLAALVKLKMEKSITFKSDGSVQCADEDDDGNLRYNISKSDILY